MCGSVLAVGPWVMQMVTAERELASAQQERIKSELMELCNRAGAVIFYRMQPDFKAEIAKLTRRYPFQLRNIRFIKFVFKKNKCGAGILDATE